jgi:NAD(P)-dependent dehydrogenase (short-subunit alcohol dehydrogenase family)
VLITGGAQRLGRAMALAFAKAGWNVAFTYLNSQNQAEQLVKEIIGEGRSGHAVPCDVRDENSIAAAVASVVDRFSGIDVLINNAGKYETVQLDQITATQWDDMFAVNVRGPFLFSQLAAPHLRKAGGRIINMGSLGGEKAWPSHAHYCSSKAALHMLTRTMARALAPEIAVNCVAPGMIEADAHDAADLLSSKLAARTPMGKNGTPEDIVNAVMYFATCSRFLTGQILTVDGGLGLV